MRIRVTSVILPDQVRLEYAEQGSRQGFPLIFLHGYADSWRTFRRVLDYLPDTIHAFALTQRGHGDSSHPVTGYRPCNFSNDLAEFMDALCLESAVIAGGSSGGIVARRFALDHPERTRGLVFMGSPLTLQGKPVVKELWESTISKLKDPVDPGFVRRFTDRQVSRRVPKVFLETMIKENLKVPAGVWTQVLKGLLEDDSSEELDKLKAPTLIIWGDKDSIISRSEQETMLKRISGSRLVVYPGAGHALYWEEPGRVALDIQAFLEDLKLFHRAYPPGRD